jgi:hypothetical protein
MLSLIGSPALTANVPVQTERVRSVSLPAGQVIDHDYFAAGPLVQISGTINGDLYAAGGQVLIDGRVDGDAERLADRRPLGGVLRPGAASPGRSAQDVPRGGRILRICERSPSSITPDTSRDAPEVDTGN